jgi:predicted AAA+ superfamily ATPase
MKRTLEKELLKWSNKPNRLPLIIQGARQVGKTYLMKWLGAIRYSKMAYLNFDERPELRTLFLSNKDVDRIITELGYVVGFRIDSDTLVVLDELQECPEALSSLKYFAEGRPDISVVGAGSLLGILLHSGHSFPVGKVEFMTLHPMTFREVLGVWSPSMLEYLEQRTVMEPLPEVFYNDLKFQFKRYLISGGMPKSVEALTQTSDALESDAVLDNLLLAYRGDFAKHPRASDVAKLSLIWDSIPSQLARENKKFMFSLVRSGARAREYEDALEWLVRSGLVHRLRQVSKPGLPLKAYEDASAFKIYLCDVGLLRRMARLPSTIYAEGDRMFTEFHGALTENYVLQSLTAQKFLNVNYWNSGNTAEVDFVLQSGSLIVPAEAKSAENIRSRSLSVYTQKFHPDVRIRFSLRNLDYTNGLLNIPLFLTDWTEELIALSQRTNEPTNELTSQRAPEPT